MTVDNLFKISGFNKMALIQKKVLDNFKSEKNMVIVSPTGTGKTHAYLFPILADLTTNKSDNCQMVIILPTNELVFQVEKMIKDLATDLTIRTYYGTMLRDKENKWLSNNQPNIVIGTPNKILEYHRSGALKLYAAKYLVIDEADMLFELDFMEEIDPILSIYKKIRLFLVSATITENMTPFIKSYFGNHQVIDTTKEIELEIDFYNLKIGMSERIDYLKSIIEVINPYLCLIFVSKKEDQLHVYQELANLGLEVGNLSGNLNVKTRKKSLEDVHNLKYQYLITSDIASRGIDFDASHIINYDIPNNLEYFTHRSGRTARMGKSGMVITLVKDNDNRKIDNLEKKGIKFINAKIIDNSLIPIKEKGKTKLTDEELKAIRAIRKPKKVKPNYKKKNKAKIKKELRKVRYSKDAKTRKSR
ncbi:MAG: DEAD/DEAH box helicase [Acholeplasmataceae bacterium]|nr:DEAD/DEAH box helicase [Acholeplasmataceae bacterium]